MMTEGGQAAAESQFREGTTPPPKPAPKPTTGLAPTLNGGPTPAARQANPEDPTPPSGKRMPELLLARLSKGACMGKCPVFRASISRPARLVFDGRRYVPRKGRSVYQLQDAFIRNLLTDARQKKLMQLEPTKPGPPDAPTDTLYLFLEGKPRTFIYSTLTAPKELTEFAQTLQENVMNVLHEQEPISDRVLNGQAKP